MNVELLRAPSDADRELVKVCALNTIGKRIVNKPTSEWLHAMLEARHSPIRELRFVFRLEGVPTWVATHLTRHHVGVNFYQRSQRNDRQTVYDRNAARQDAPVDLIVSINAEALMVMANKRLCQMAAPETRYAVSMMCRLAEAAMPELTGLLVPMCEYNGGICHELYPCGRCTKK